MLLAKPPEDVAALKTFIGQWIWLSKHIEDYSKMILPLRVIVNRYPAKEKQTSPMSGERILRH